MSLLFIFGFIVWFTLHSLYYSDYPPQYCTFCALYFYTQNTGLNHHIPPLCTILLNTAGTLPMLLTVSLELPMSVTKYLVSNFFSSPILPSNQQASAYDSSQGNPVLKVLCFCVQKNKGLNIYPWYSVIFYNKLHFYCFFFYFCLNS